MVVGPFQRQRPEQRGEGLGAAAGVARLSVRRRTLTVESEWSASSALKYCASACAANFEDSTTQCLLEGLEVLRVDPRRGPMQRSNFSRKRGYERWRRNRLHGLARRGERSTVNGLQEGLEVLRIHASSSQERVDVGLDRRLQRCEHLLLEAPFFRPRDRAVQSTATRAWSESSYPINRPISSRSIPPTANPHFPVVHPAVADPLTTRARKGAATPWLMVLLNGGSFRIFVRHTGKSAMNTPRRCGGGCSGGSRGAGR